MLKTRRSRVAALPVALMCAALLPILVACGNSGPVWPGTPPGGSDSLAPPVAPPVQDPYQPPAGQLPDEDTGDQTALIPTTEIPTGSAHELASALVFLRDSGGGTTSTDLEPDQLLIHVWDALTENNLQAEAAVVCADGPASQVNINGCGMFENATFPLTVTVYTAGYAMSTYVGTSANVLSFAMTRATEPQDAYIFGVIDADRAEHLQIYGDGLMPHVYYVYPSTVNANFMQYEIPVTAGRHYGLSAFAFSNIQPSDGISDGVVFMNAAPLYWMAGYFAWDFMPLSAGDRYFHALQFGSKGAPDGVAAGIATVPPGIIDADTQRLDGKLVAIPTAIFAGDERYQAVGPHANAEVDGPDQLAFSCPWFEPTETPDRIVMAGCLVHSSGAIDIIHEDWATGTDSPDLNFSGIAGLVVSIDFGGGSMFPTFSLSDPPALDSDLVRIQAYYNAVTPSWFITLDGGLDTVDSGDFAIPLDWVPQVFGNLAIRFRSECIDAAAVGIDDFNEDQIVLTRHETCYSPWVAPVI
jgi:hypothetical protein